MKRLYLLLALITASPFCANAQSSNGLIAHWDFSPSGTINPTVPDVSGNGFNGTTHNITFVSGQTGQPNTAAHFNGTSSYISAAYQSTLNMNQYSICAIVKVNGFNTGYCQESVIFATGMYPTNGGISLTMGDNPFDNDNCNHADTSKQVFRNSAGSALPNGASQWQYTPTIRTNRWYNVTATYSNNVFKIFVDGQLVNTVPAPTGTMGNNTNLGINIGKNPLGASSTNFWFNGLIDDLQLYNRVLADSEIVDHSNDVYINQKIDTLCVGKAFNLNYSTIGTYPSGNIFTAQLSDATGSFANPTIIGNTTAQTSGTISCFIPSGITTTSGYKIRVVTSKDNDVSDAIAIAYLHIGNAATVNITAAPSSSVGPYTSVLFSSNVTNAGSNPTFQWRKNGIDIAGATNATYTAVSAVDFNSNDNINLFVTGNIACTDKDSATSNTISTNVNLSINSLNASGNLKISPNPSNGVFTISGKVDATETLQIEVFNTLGQQVYHNNIQTTNGILNQTIELPNLPSGPYKMRLKAGVESKLLPIQIQ